MKVSASFTGNVIVGQGEMRLSAQKLLVIYKSEGGIERLEASGGVTLVSGPDAAEADRADYSIDTGIVVMTGNVLLTQGNNALTSQKMTVNLVDGSRGGNVSLRDTPATLLLADAGPVLEGVADDTLLAVTAQALGSMEALLEQTVESCFDRVHQVLNGRLFSWAPLELLS